MQAPGSLESGDLPKTPAWPMRHALTLFSPLRPFTVMHTHTLWGLCPAFTLLPSTGTSYAHIFSSSILHLPYATAATPPQHAVCRVLNMLRRTTKTMTAESFVWIGEQESQPL
jgi:hypothetical protein